MGGMKLPAATTRFKKFIPGWARRPLMGVFICSKTVIGVFAFKAVETAMHVATFEAWTIAAVVTVTILLPVAGLTALTEEID